MRVTHLEQEPDPTQFHTYICVVKHHFLRSKLATLNAAPIRFERRLLELFGDGRSNFKIAFNVTVGPDGTTVTELWIKIRAMHRRESKSMDEITREWFDTTVRASPLT